MLVLTRTKNESVLIGQDIEVTICAVEGGKVKLGFRAPENVRIMRKEIVDSPTKEEKQRQ